jgi:hypothetical protein
MARLQPGQLHAQAGDAQDGAAVSLTSLREKLIGLRHGHYVTFQLAEVAVPLQMFADIRSLIAQLRAPPPSA